MRKTYVAKVKKSVEGIFRFFCSVWTDDYPYVQMLVAFSSHTYGKIEGLPQESSGRIPRKSDLCVDLGKSSSTLQVR